MSGTFDIGDGRRMFLECTGSGSPTVILVGGQRASAEDWAIVAEDVDSPSVYALVGADTRVCAYDRPGTPVGEAPSRSDPVDQPTTAADMVSDLRALVGAAGIEEPFVIVGHSAGGLAARLYAATYPDDVSGMVLVDALGEGLRDHMTAEQWAIQKPMLRGDIDASIAEYPALEWIEPDASFDQMRAAGGLRRMPLIVISADQPIGPTIPALKAAGVLGQEVPDDFGYVTDAAQVKSQADLAASVPGSIHVTETNSGHNVHIEQPALVAGAILDVVRLVRDGIDVATG
ncbi:alpha/beta hydrolase [Microbacterium sp. NPDC064584]|uniref:alpha/beta fold hydrolase n=1 Tax=Microbacterium sp. NPDC064584 TaxID=3155817 RepID=UPI0034383C40